MDFSQITAQIADLPSAFTRPGAVYQQLQNSFSGALLRGCSASDGIIGQLGFQNATGVWLDAWGKLYGLSRKANEADSVYKARITFTLLCGKGPPIAIRTFVETAEGIPDATIVENLPNVGWNMNITTSVSSETLNQVANDVVYVRPAGVPFGPFSVLRGGSYLGTVNYLGAGRVTGAYIFNPLTTFNFAIPESTNNSLSQLPTTFLSDPTINPSLAAA